MNSAGDKSADWLFKYPPMERQDLNQSQLGSFKFTPVDNVGPRDLEAFATRFLNQQFASRLASVKAGAYAQSGPASPSADPEFFNKHIKPALGDSRLRLGPAAVRSAVQRAAHSPTRQSHVLADQTNSDRIQIDRPAHSLAYQHHDPGNTKTFTQAYNQRYQPTASGDSLPETMTQANDISLSSSQRVIASSLASAPLYQIEGHVPATFVQSTPQDLTMDTRLPLAPNEPDPNHPIGLPDPICMNQSLCLALLREQQAHHVTRLALNEETLARLDAESELQVCIEKFRRLQMKHKLTQDELRNSGGVESRTVAAEQRARTNDVRVWADEQQADASKCQPNGQGQPQLLEQALQQQAPEESQILSEAKCDGVEINTAKDIDDLNDLNGYDLGVWERREAVETLTPSARAVYLKHFVAPVQGDDAASAASVNQLSNHLIERSPNASNHQNKTDKQQSPAFVSVFSRPLPETSKGFPSDMSSNEARRQLLTTATPVLDLPPEFKAKYGKKPTKSTDEDLADGLSNLSVTDNDGVVDMKSSDRVGSRDSAVPDTGPITSTYVLPETFAGKPRWLVRKDNPIFANDQEKFRAQSTSGQPMDPTSQFYQHPVRYLPEDAVTKPNVYRTVMIEEIPLETTVREVLNIVQGGALESIELVGPIGKATDYMTARLVFVRERAARAMADLQHLHIRGSRVNAWLVEEPTYPRSSNLNRLMFGNTEASRILVVANIDECQYGWVQTRMQQLPLGRDVVEFGDLVEGQAFIEFKSIKAAVKSVEALLLDKDLVGIDCHFEPDSIPDLE